MFDGVCHGMPRTLRWGPYRPALDVRRRCSHALSGMAAPIAPATPQCTMRVPRYPLYRRTIRAMVCFRWSAEMTDYTSPSRTVAMGMVFDRKNHHAVHSGEPSPGDPGGNRTPNTQFRRLMLYPLSYRAIPFSIAQEILSMQFSPYHRLRFSLLP